VRRLIDILGSSIGLILLAPVFLAIGIIIRIDSTGPVFYRAVRVGKDGHLFKLLKFRSMVAGAAQAGPGITRHGDSRITRAGRWLRKYKLDELPQLINVLKGDMSLVGPRPEDPRYVAYYNSEQRTVLKVKPGITSPASLYFRHEEQLLDGDDWHDIYLNQVLPEKLQLEIQYLNNRTLLSDLKLICKTLLAVVH